MNPTPHTPHGTRAFLLGQCVALLLIGVLGCDDEPATTTPPTPTTAKSTPSTPKAKKPVLVQKDGLGRTVKFNLEWTGESYRSERNHISHRMNFFAAKPDSPPTRTILPKVEGLSEKEGGKDYREGFCAYVAKKGMGTACPAEGDDPTDAETILLTASVITDPVALKAAGSKDKKKDAKKKSAPINSAANISVAGTLALNEGWEHFRFKIKFRATSSSPAKTKGWYRSLGSFLAQEWVERLSERLQKGERTLRPSKAINWVSSIPPDILPDESTPPLYTMRTMVAGTTFMCLSAFEGGHSCTLIDPTGKSGSTVRFAMGEAGEHERRALKTWMRPDPDRKRILFVGDMFEPAEGQAPEPPLKGAKQNVWVVSLNTKGELDAAAIIPDYFPHSPALTDAEGNIYVVAWGVREMELVQASPEGTRMQSWRLPKFAQEHNLIWLDNKRMAILPEGGKGIYAIDTNNPRARPKTIWSWPAGQSPTFNDHVPHVVSDHEGGLLILEGNFGDVRTAYRVSGNGQTLWKLRLGTSPEFRHFKRVGNHGVLLGEELRFVNLQEGILESTRDTDVIYSITKGPKDTLIGCSRSDVRVYENLKPTKRNVRLKGGCDTIAPHKDSFVALQAWLAAGLGSLDTWSP